MRTPAHAPSARLSRAAGPMPPRSSARRVLRPLPTPRKRRGEAMAERHSAIDSTGPPSRGVTVPPGRRERLGGGPFRGPITYDGYRGAPRLGRGAKRAGGVERWGVWGRVSGAHPLRRVARRAAAGAGGDARWGGWGAISGPHHLRRLSRRAAAWPGRDERWGVWGAISGPHHLRRLSRRA